MKRFIKPIEHFHPGYFNYDEELDNDFLERVLEPDEEEQREIDREREENDAIRWKEIVEDDEYGEFSDDIW